MVGPQAASLRQALREQIASYEGLFLRPRRAALDELAQAIEYRGSDPGEDVWARAIAAGRIPASFADDPERRFRGTSKSPQPTDAYAALVYASDPHGLREAEGHARELVERFANWGGPVTRQVTWRLGGGPLTEHDKRPRLAELGPLLARMRAELGKSLQFPSHEPRFQPVVDALVWTQHWQRLAGELPNPFEPWLALVRTGYWLESLKRSRGGELTIELLAPLPRTHASERADAPRAVWSKRLSGLRMACMRGDIGELREGLPLLAADDEPGQPRLIHFAVYAGPAALEQLAAHAKLDLEAQDRLGRTALLLAAGLPREGPPGAREHEVDVPLSEIAGARACAWLLDAGADRHARDHRGWTALHWAAANGRARCLEVLLQAKLELDAIDHRGRTPAMLAVHAHVQHRTSEPLDLLLRAGADMDVRDGHGWTVLHHLAAISRGTSDLNLARKLLHHLAAISQGTSDRTLSRRLVDRGAIPSRDRAGRSPADVAAWRFHSPDPGGPFDPRTPVAAGPRKLEPAKIEPSLLAPLLDQLVPPLRDPAAPHTETAPKLDDWQVWADWLQSHGDPRGELLACELACVGVGGSKRRLKQGSLDSLRARLHSHIYASLECADALAPVRPSPIELDTTHGCVTGARIGGLGGPIEWTFDAARALLELEPLLASLSLELGNDGDWQPLIDRLATLAPQLQVRRLILHDLPAELPKLDALAAVFPRLRSLHLYGRSKLHGGALRWPGVVDLRVRHAAASEWRAGNVALRFDLPDLTHLDLGLPTGSRTTAEEIRGTVDTLEHMGPIQHLRLAPLEPEFAAALLACALIGRLRTLELVGVRGSSLDSLVQHAAVLAKLERVRVSIPPVAAQQRPQVIEQLRQALPRLELDGQGRKRKPFAAWV